MRKQNCRTLASLACTLLLISGVAWGTETDDEQRRATTTASAEEQEESVPKTHGGISRDDRHESARNLRRRFSPDNFVQNLLKQNPILTPTSIQFYDVEIHKDRNITRIPGTGGAETYDYSDPEISGFVDDTDLAAASAGTTTTEASAAGGDPRRRYIVAFETEDAYETMELIEQAGGVKEALNQAGGRRALRGKPGFAMMEDLDYKDFPPQIIQSLSSIKSTVMMLEPETAQDWNDNNAVVKEVEVDPLRYMMQETLPYGIVMVKALDVPDDVVDPAMTVCVIDSGLNEDHPDINKDQANGISFTSEGQNSWSNPGSRHGTHVAGIIGAVGNNGLGTMGVIRSGQVGLYSIKVFGNDGRYDVVSAYGSTLVDAFAQCAKAGARVVNLSLGGGNPVNAEKRAIDKHMEDDGMLFIAAAGNTGKEHAFYPSSYNNVIRVGSIGRSQTVSKFSTKGDDIDLVAPGESIYSTVLGSGYAYISGTSMSCPFVSGAAALIWSHHPEKTPFEIRDALINSAQFLPNQTSKNNSAGNGYLRVDLALDYLGGNFEVAEPPPATTCADSPEGWYDKDGIVYDCNWYARGSNCSRFGNMYRRNGFTASEACCACGGGARTPVEVVKKVQAPTRRWVTNED